MLRLTQLDGPDAGRVTLLTDSGAIGRDPSRCQVVVANGADSVSRLHARLTQDRAGWWLTDEGSTHGTFLEDARVTTAVRLTACQVVRVGEVAFAVDQVADAQDAPGRGGIVRALSLGAVTGLLGVAMLAAVPMLRVLAPGQSAPLPSRTPGAVSIAPSGPVPLGEPAFAAAVRELLTDLSGAPSTCPIPELFLRDVQDELVAVLGSRRSMCPVLQWQPVIAARLEAEARATGGPVSRAQALAYLPWVESRYEAEQACSVAGARGMWQFLPGTARTFGLAVAPGIDERCDWDASTSAAWAYFTSLFQRCGDDHPLLAIAGYNTGAGRSCAHVDTDDVCGGWDFRPFYERGTLHAETTEYVPRFVASWLLGEHAELALAVAREREPDLEPLPGCDVQDFVPAAPRSCSTGPEQCVDRRGEEAPTPSSR